MTTSVELNKKFDHTRGTTMCQCTHFNASLRVIILSALLFDKLYCHSSNLML